PRGALSARIVRQCGRHHGTMRGPPSRRLGRAGFLPRPALKPYKERKRLGLDDRNLSGLLHPVFGRPARAGQRGALGALRELLPHMAAAAARGCAAADRFGGAATWACRRSRWSDPASRTAAAAPALCRAAFAAAGALRAERRDRRGAMVRACRGGE